MMNKDLEWIMKDGKKIKVSSMSTNHIENSLKAIKENRINFLIKCGYAQDNDYIEYIENDSERDFWIETFEKELEERRAKLGAKPKAIDITLCVKKDCPKKCLRYVDNWTPDDYWQSYSEPNIEVDENGNLVKCNMEMIEGD